MNDLNTVAGAEAELKETEAVYDADRTARLTERQAHRKTLKTLVQSLKDRDARLSAVDKRMAANTDSDTAGAKPEGLTGD